MRAAQDLLQSVSAAADGLLAYRAILSFMQERFECEVASLHVAAAYPVTRSGPIATLGFQADVLRACVHRWPSYVKELEALGRASVKTRGVISDRDVFSAAERSRKAYYRELSLAEGGLDALVGYLCFRGKPMAALMLANRGRRSVQGARAELLELLPALTLAVAAGPAREGVWAHDAHLTERECEVLSYAARGLTNAEIARCLDASVNTIRNHIAALLRKLELNSRAELAASGLHAFCAAPSEK